MCREREAPPRAVSFLSLLRLLCKPDNNRGAHRWTVDKHYCIFSLDTVPTILTRDWTPNLSCWYRDMQEHLLTRGPVWAVTQNERVVGSKSNSKGKFADRKFKGSGKTEQINIDLDNIFWLDLFWGLKTAKWRNSLAQIICGADTAAWREDTPNMNHLFILTLPKILLRNYNSYYDWWLQVMPAVVFLDAPSLIHYQSKLCWKENFEGLHIAFILPWVLCHKQWLKSSL